MVEIHIHEPVAEERDRERKTKSECEREREYGPNELVSLENKTSRVALGEPVQRIQRRPRDPSFTRSLHLLGLFFSPMAKGLAPSRSLVNLAWRPPAHEMLTPNPAFIVAGAHSASVPPSLIV